MTVVMKGGTTGNRDKNAIVPMPSGQAQPLLNTATKTKADNTLFVAEQHRGVHPAQQATPDFMPKGCVPEPTSSDVFDPGA